MRGVMRAADCRGSFLCGWSGRTEVVIASFFLLLASLHPSRIVWVAAVGGLWGFYVMPRAASCCQCPAARARTSTCPRIAFSHFRQCPATLASQRSHCFFALPSLHRII